jgi:acetyl-CoA carboxylase biotin carboxyl carrier protein
VELNFSELRELLAVINQTDVAEFTLKSGDFELVVRKGTQVSDAAVANPVHGIEGLPAPASPAVMPSLPSAAVTPVPSAAPPAVSPRSTEKWVEVISPMVGTFYRAPGPDESVFVEVGDRIRPGQTVCIIEAMKLMNELEAEVAGEVVEILVQNGEPVEYGQVLMRVNPD